MSEMTVIFSGVAASLVVMGVVSLAIAPYEKRTFPVFQKQTPTDESNTIKANAEKTGFKIENIEGNLFEKLPDGIYKIPIQDIQSGQKYNATCILNRHKKTDALASDLSCDFTQP